MITKKTSACSAIDTSLFLDTNGGVKVCCGGSFYLGNIKDDTISNIFKNDKTIEIKKSLEDQTFPKYCNNCEKHESIAPGSSELSSFKRKNYLKLEYRKLQHVDLRWSNHCNLSCKYCGPDASSVWASLWGIQKILYSNRDNKNFVLEEIKNNVSTIKHVNLLGGEPLLQKENAELFDIIKDNPEIKVNLLTNASVNLTKNKIYNNLRKLKNVYIFVSIDNIQERFEYVRFGANWEELKQNLNILKDDFGEIRFNPVYSIWNATRLQEYFDFVNNYTNNIDGISWSLIVKKPFEGFSVFEHNDKIKEIALREIESVNKNINSQQQIDFFNGVKNSIINTNTFPNIHLNFLKNTKYLENLMPYHKSLKDLWPELIVNM